MAFDSTILTDDTTGLFKQIEDEMANLEAVIPFYETVLDDAGVNNDYELGDLLVTECYNILNIIETMTKRLENIRYGSLPCPPCHDGGYSGTIPDGWGTCV